MSIVKDIISITINENKFDFTKLPQPNKKDEITSHIGFSVKNLKKNDDFFQANVLFVLIVGDDGEEIKNVLEKGLKIEELNSYLYLNIRIVVNLREEILPATKDEKKLDITPEIGQEFMELAEPFIRETILYHFQRSRFPAPNLPYHFWRKSDES